jgi:catechol 2,3-dioxygenase-like lactoylglutathione lyase family enzyme
MDVTVSTCFIAVDDHDKALAFYPDVLGFEVAQRCRLRGMRRITVGQTVTTAHHTRSGTDTVATPPDPVPDSCRYRPFCMYRPFGRNPTRG